MDHEAPRRGGRRQPAHPGRVHVPRGRLDVAARRSDRSDPRVRPDGPAQTRRSSAHDPSPHPAARPGRPAARRGGRRRGVGAVGAPHRRAVPRARGGDHRRHPRRSARRGDRSVARRRRGRAGSDAEVRASGWTARHPAGRGRRPSVDAVGDGEPGRGQRARDIGRASAATRRRDAVGHRPGGGTPVARGLRAGSVRNCERSVRRSTPSGPSRFARSCAGSGRSWGRRATPTCCWRGSEGGSR